MAVSEEEEVKTPTTSNDIKSAVETAGSVDESDNDDEEVEDDDTNSEADDSKGGDSTDEDTEEEDNSDEKSDEDDSKGGSDEDDKSKSDDKSGYRFTQFAGDGKPETYISNLEKAYENSSAEGIRLNQDLRQATARLDNIVEAAKADPDLRDKLVAVLEGKPGAASPKGEAAPTTDPFLVDAKTKWEKQSTEEAEAFIKSNPEVVSDPKINGEVKHWMEVFSREQYQKEGTLMTAGEAMSKAYKYLGYEDKREQRKSLSDTKKAVAPTRPQGSRKPAKTGSDFTDSQLNLAGHLGLSKEKLDKFAK